MNTISSKSSTYLYYHFYTMFQSFLALFPSIPTWVGIVADICTILTFIGMFLSQKKEIKELQLQITKSNSDNINNSFQYTENKIGYNFDEVIKLIKEIKPVKVKKSSDKYVTIEEYKILVEVVDKLVNVVSTYIDTVSPVILKHQEIIKDIIGYMRYKLDHSFLGIIHNKFLSWLEPKNSKS